MFLKLNISHKKYDSKEKLNFISLKRRRIKDNQYKITEAQPSRTQCRPIKNRPTAASRHYSAIRHPTAEQYRVNRKDYNSKSIWRLTLLNVKMSCSKPTSTWWEWHCSNSRTLLYVTMLQLNRRPLQKLRHRQKLNVGMRVYISACKVPVIL